MNLTRSPARARLVVLVRAQDPAASLRPERQLPGRLRRRVLTAAFFAIFAAIPAGAANVTWIGGDAVWSDNAGTASWSPADEPDADDVAIFNTNNTIILGTNNEVAGLTMSAGSELDLNGSDLVIAGATTLSGGGTLLEAPAGTVLTGQNITINNGATVFLDGGRVMAGISGITNATVAMAGGGTLSGNGSVTMTDAFASPATAINNNGTINASNPSASSSTPPAAATLRLSAADANARIDLDGSLESGQVMVSRNQTLSIELPPADIFNGDLTMTQGTTLDMSASWILGAAATVNIDNGAIIGLPGTPAGTATIAGGALSQNSGRITVVDQDGTLQFDAPFTMNGGLFDNNGHVIFNQAATLGTGAGFNMGSAKLTVEANRTLNISQTNFDLDGPETGATVITVNPQGRINLTSTDYDADAAANAFDGTINLNGGTFNEATGDPHFVMDGVLNMTHTAGAAPAWDGDRLEIGNDLGALSADFNVLGGGDVSLLASISFKSDADVHIDPVTTLRFMSPVTFETVNGPNHAEFTGDGSLIFFDEVIVNEAVTLNMPGGTVTLDGQDGTGNLVNIVAPLTINAQSFSDFGNSNGDGVPDTLHIARGGRTGLLFVSLADEGAAWSLNPQAVMNLVNDNTPAMLLAGSDINLNGTVNVTGDVEIAALVHIGSTATINLNTAGEPLRLGGGSPTGPNRINGGTITGPGRLGANTDRSLFGFGTINCAIEFSGTANLAASGGTLNLNGNVVSVNMLGTTGDTGVLNIANPWFTGGGPGGVIGAVVLNGGTLQGAPLANDNVNGIQGHGTITSRIVNNTKLVATTDGTLLVQAPASHNDWDGTTNTGELQALSADLELRDEFLFGLFAFTGKVRAINNHQVFTNGFGLDFNPGSTLELEDDASYRSTRSTHISGTLTVATGADATIQVTNGLLEFHTGSTTTLNGNLRLVNNAINIDHDAVFSGPGTLIVPAGSHLTARDGAHINVELDMQGDFSPSSVQTTGRIGRIDMHDYRQAATSTLFVDVEGTALIAFDRLVLTGNAQLDGRLFIRIVPNFVPALGQTFNIITANVVTGTFSSIAIEGMPNGLSFHVEYLQNAVQLQVVTGTPFINWINSFSGLTPEQKAKTADPDNDGRNNFAEFALDGIPNNGQETGKVAGKVGTIAGSPVFALTLPVRTGAVQDITASRFVLRQADDGVNYTIEASNNVTNFSLPVTEVTGGNAAAFQEGLPALNPGWIYRTFRGLGTVTGDPRAFMRARVAE